MADKVILLREGVLKSWLSDTFTFAMLAGLPWLNHNYLGGSAWIYAAIAFAWFVSIIARASGLRSRSAMTPVEARAWLDQHYPVEG